MKHRIVFAAAAILVTTVGCGGTKQPIQTVSGTTQTAAGAAARAARQVQHLAETVVNASFVVEPRAYKSFKVVVAPGVGNARIEGTFTASGANNDIEVMLLEESQFLNWQNRHKFTATYESGRVTSDNIRLELPASPGTYFMVFSNRFSIWSNKGVVADVKLLFDKAL